jgi:hypothetical protein
LLLHPNTVSGLLACGKTVLKNRVIKHARKMLAAFDIG